MTERDLRDEEFLERCYYLDTEIHPPLIWETASALVGEREEAEAKIKELEARIKEALVILGRDLPINGYEYFGEGFAEIVDEARLTLGRS